MNAKLRNLKWENLIQMKVIKILRIYLAEFYFKILIHCLRLKCHCKNKIVCEDDIKTFSQKFFFFSKYTFHI